MLAWAFRRSPVLLLGLLLACGDDPARDDGGGGAGGAEAAGAVASTASVAGPVAVSSAATSSAATGGGSPTSTGAGGENGEGGGLPALTCTDAPLPGAGGCTPDDPGAATADDCATPENESCTARALCGTAAPPFPRPAGPGLAYAEHAGGVGTVDGDLAYTELLADARLLATSAEGVAIVTRSGTVADELSVLRADGSLGPSWMARGWDHGAVTPGGRIVLATGVPTWAHVEGVPPGGEGHIALAALTTTGAVAWGRRLGTSDGPGATLGVRGIAPLGDDVIVVGQYERLFDLGGVMLPEVVPYGDLGYVARIDGATGEVLWAQPVGHPFGGTANAVAVTADGEILVGGAVFRSADAPGTVATLLRLSADGDLVWQTHTGASDVGGRQAIDGVVVTPSGVLVGVGWFTHVLRAGDVDLVNDSFGPDAMVLSFDGGDGAITSVRTWGSRGLDDPQSGTDDRAWDVSAFCDHVVVGGDVEARSRAVIGGHVVENHDTSRARVVLELPAEGSWPTEDGGGGDVCADATAYCDARVERSLLCGMDDHVSSCEDEEPCLAATLRDDVACDVRTCQTAAPCDVDCEEVGLDSDLTAVGATFEAACAEAIGEGCGAYLPVGTCARLAHRRADAYLEALLPCVSPPRSCPSTALCLRAVENEWARNAAGCGPEPALDPAICADEAALCEAIADRTAACIVENPFLVGTATPQQCLATQPAFGATYRDEVECVLEACFAGAACNVDCRERILLVPPSPAGEALIEGCLLVGSCADLFTGECTRIAHAWPDDRIEAVLPCFDGSLSCDDAADCLGDVGPNAWYP